MRSSYVVASGEEGRLDRFVVSKHPEWSRGLVQKLVEAGKASVGGSTVDKPSFPVVEGMSVEIEHPQPFDRLKPFDHPLEILYEDESILAVNKPAGLVTHPQDGEEEGSLVQAVLAIRPEIADVLYDPESLVSRLRPGVVHRLDKDTSGAVVFAKTAQAMENLAGQFKDHLPEKRYLAICLGILAEPLTLHTKMGRKPARQNLMGVRPLSEEGREAVTVLEPLSHASNATLLGCWIRTGRTHQIRVHCKYCGHPVLGDLLYTNKTATALSLKLKIGRQMLHARRLAFRHPLTGADVSLLAPIPADFLAAADRLGLAVPAEA